MEESKKKVRVKKVKKVLVEEKNDNPIIICPENMKPVLFEFTLIMKKESDLSRSRRDWVQAFITKQIKDGVIKLKE